MASVSQSKNKNEPMSDSGSESGSDIGSISGSETGNVSDTQPPKTVESGESQGKSGIVSNILQSVGQFLLSILLSIVSGFFNFVKSNWIILLIFGTIGFVIYYIYSNAMNFLSSFTDLFKNLQPILSSTASILGTTTSKTSTTSDATETQSSDSTDKINSLTRSTHLDTSKSNDGSLETSLKAPDTKHTTHASNSDIDDDDNGDNGDNDDDGTNDPSTKTINTDNLTPSNNNHETGVEGYCFIGTDNGIRACAPVGKNNKCMSGEIFPSLQICMDPKLRE